MVSFPQTQILNLIRRKHQRSSSWRAFYKITDQKSSKVSRTWKTRKSRETVTTGRDHADIVNKWSKWRIPGLEKDILTQTGEIWIHSIVNNIVPILISWFWQSDYGLYGVNIRDNWAMFQIHSVLMCNFCVNLKLIKS